MQTILNTLFRPLCVPARSPNVGLLVGLTVRNNALFDIVDLNDLFPGLKVQVKDSLMFRNIFFLNLFRGVRVCGICVLQISCRFHTSCVDLTYEE